MNQYFSINRFWMLFRKEFSERIPTMTKVAVIFSLILVAGWLLSILLSMTSSMFSMLVKGRFAYLLIVTLVMTIFSPLILYYSTNNRKKGIDYITLPASFNEKFVSMLLNTLIIFPLIVISSILATDLIISTIHPTLVNGSIIFSNEIWSIWNISNISNISDIPIDIHISVAGRISLQVITGYSLFLFCNALYRRNKTLKSIISILVFYSIIGLISSSITYLAFKGEFENGIIESSMNILSDSDSINKLKQLQLISDIFSYGVIPIAALTGAYIKMKRQQY